MILLLIAVATGKSAMRYLCAILCLTLVSCGGSSPTAVITTQSAQAQTLRLTNLSAVTGPMDVVTVTCNQNSLTSLIYAVVPNTPIAGHAYISAKVDAGCAAGQTITLSNSFPATSANNGTYTVVTHNPGFIGWEITCANCVTYNDSTGTLPPHNVCSPGECSMTADGFPAVVTDGSGLTHVIFERGSGNQGSNPDNIAEMTTSDGVTFSAISTIAADTSMSCTAGGFASNCSYWSPMAGKLPNGNIILMAQILDWATSASKGVFWWVYDINSHTWGARNQLTGTAPDGSTWVASYGRWFIYGSTACAGMFNSGSYNEVWFGCTSDNGATFSGFHRVNWTINEGLTVPAGGNNVVGIYRTNRVLALNNCNTAAPCGTFEIFSSSDSGATWTNADSSVGASTQTTSWELVGQDAYCASTTACILFYGLRDYTNGAGVQLAASFNPQTLHSDPTAIGVPVTLATATGIATSDCCYISADKMANGKMLIFFYHPPYSTNFGWKLYYMTADLTPATGIAISHSQVIGTLR